ncbi:hypothetical protein D1007_23414 [Hordeum vulgare]|nr:hypothetical protein D1007_23414 [Hordeum vulgare]
MAAEASGSRAKGVEDLGVLLERLHLEEDERDDLVWEDEAEDPDEKPKWLALARVLTNKSFEQGALIDDMKAAWNLARDVVWRRINSNLFSVQSIVWQIGIRRCTRALGLQGDGFDHSGI